MAVFLSAQQTYRMFQRELPEGAYADGAPSAFFTTASIYAKSVMVEAAYDNMENMYLNYFPQSAEEKQADWEFKVFGFTLNAALSLPIRRQTVINKLRLKPGITINDMLNAVRSVIGDDKDIEISEWGCNCCDDGTGGTWVIGVSQLGINTILGSMSGMGATPFLFPDADLCGDPSQFGISPEDWALIQQDAYTYSVLIYSYMMTAQERADVDALLTKSEPARSTHVIYDGLDPADHILNPGE